MRKSLAIAISIFTVFFGLWVVDAMAAAYPTGVGGTGTTAAPQAGQTLIGTGSSSYTPGFITCTGNCRVSNSSGTIAFAVPPGFNATGSSGELLVLTGTSTGQGYPDVTFDSSTGQLQLPDIPSALLRTDGYGNIQGASDGADYWSPSSLSNVSQLNNDANYYDPSNFIDGTNYWSPTTLTDDGQLTNGAGYTSFGISGALHNLPVYIGPNSLGPSSLYCFSNGDCSVGSSTDLTYTLGVNGTFFAAQTSTFDGQIYVSKPVGVPGFVLQQASGTDTTAGYLYKDNTGATQLSLNPFIPNSEGAAAYLFATRNVQQFGDIANFKTSNATVLDIESMNDGKTNGGQVGINDQAYVLPAILTVVDTTSTKPVILAKGAVSQTADLFDAENSSSVILANIDSSGDISTVGKAVVGTTTPVELFSIDTNGNLTSGYESIDTVGNERLKLGYNYNGGAAGGIANNNQAAQIIVDSGGNLQISPRTNVSSTVNIYSTNGTTAKVGISVAPTTDVNIATTTDLGTTLGVAGTVSVNSNDYLNATTTAGFGTTSTTIQISTTTGLAPNGFVIINPSLIGGTPLVPEVAYYSSFTSNGASSTLNGLVRGLFGTSAISEGAASSTSVYAMPFVVANSTSSAPTFAIGCATSVPTTGCMDAVDDVPFNNTEIAHGLAVNGNGISMTGNAIRANNSITFSNTSNGAQIPLIMAGAGIGLGPTPTYGQITATSTYGINLMVSGGTIGTQLTANTSSVETFVPTTVSSTLAVTGTSTLGYVGINTSTPDQYLTINGNIHFIGTNGIDFDNGGGFSAKTTGGSLVGILSAYTDNNLYLGPNQGFANTIFRAGTGNMQFTIGSAASALKMSIANNGDVAIGNGTTTDTGFGLYEAGSFKVVGTSTQQQTVYYGVSTTTPGCHGFYEQGATSTLAYEYVNSTTQMVVTTTKPAFCQ
ncbi:MAG TPA: hypothetical protein VKR52_04610 [Terracidiphilus sp.]|nr:hypothetical protein [Terracidiphilus sp.]